MPELTLESLSKRLEEVERKLAERERPKRDWRSTLDLFEGSEFMKQVDEEIAAMKEAERQAAREGKEQ